MDLRRADLLLAATAAGCAIGVTSDGCTTDAALHRLREHRDRGWPARPIGRPGRVTAQARALHRAVLLGQGRFDGALVAADLRELLRGATGPLEPSAHLAAADLDAGVPWWRCGERAWRTNGATEPPSRDPVARAVPLAALVRDDGQALAAAALQAMATDWSPATVLDAAAMVWLLRATLRGDGAWRDDWTPRFAADFAALAGDELDAWRAAAADDDVARTFAAEPTALACTDAAVRCARVDAGLLPRGALLPATVDDADVAGCTGPEACGMVALGGGPAAARTACAAALLAAVHGRPPAGGANR